MASHAFWLAATAVAEFFSWLWRSSWQAAIVILIVIAIQWALRNVITARWRYLLWSVVIVKLLLPVRLESGTSLFHLTHNGAAAVREHWSDRLDAESAENRFAFKENAGAGRGAPTPSRADTPPRSRSEVIPFEAATDELRPTAAMRAARDERASAAPADAAKPRDDRDVETDAVAQSDSQRVWLGGLRLIWLVGAALLLVRLAGSHVRLLRWVRRLPAVADDETLALWDECRRQSGVRRSIRLVAAPERGSPAVVGLVRPTLVVPEGILRSFTRDELRLIFLHELAHVRRFDLPVQWLVAILKTLHWFNPLVWLAARRIRVDGELACDEWVLSRLTREESHQYGQTVVRVLESQSPWSMPLGAVGIAESKRSLRQRVALIAGYRPRSRIASWAAAAVLLVLAVAGLTDRIHVMAASGDDVAAAPGPFRTWTEESGVFSLEARFVELQGDNVQLARRDGSRVTVSLARLSQNDRDYLQNSAIGASGARLTSTAKLERALANKSRHDFRKTPLSTVLEMLSTAHEIPLYLAVNKLSAADVKPDAPVVLAPQDGTLAETLEATLAPLKLGWFVRDDVLVVTTAEDADTTLVVKTYKYVPPAVEAPFPEDLADEIEQLVAPKQWPAAGGPGVLFYYEHAGTFIISQSANVHRKLREQYPKLLLEIPSPAVDTIAPPGLKIPRASLAKTVDLQLDGVRLADLARHITERYGVACQLDSEALESSEVKLDTRLTGRVRGASLASALSVVLADYDLTWSADKMGLRITTRDALDTDLHQFIVTHDVRDVMYRGDGDALVAALTTTIAPRSWRDAGGAGTARV